jgi:hypothetical protein
MCSVAVLKNGINIQRDAFQFELSPEVNEISGDRSKSTTGHQVAKIP